MRLLLKTFALSLVCAGTAMGQSSSTASPAPVTFTSDQDHQNMMDQLGIKRCVQGRAAVKRRLTTPTTMSRRPIPIPIFRTRYVMNNGEKVTTPQMWWDKRRPEIIEGYEKYVYGRVPKDVPKVTWTVTAVDHEMIGFNRVIAKDLIGQVDNSSYPAITSKFI